MNAPFEKTRDDDGELSPLWPRSIGIIMVLGFGALLAIAALKAWLGVRVRPAPRRHRGWMRTA